MTARPDLLDLARQAFEAVARLHAALHAGCTCTPDIHVGHRPEGRPDVTVTHDDDCPARKDNDR